MPDYSKGKIYRVWNNSYTKCYIGSTIQPLNKRFEKHKRSYKAFLNDKYPMTTVFHLFNEFGAKNCKIELIENFPCTNKEELLAREGHHQRENECVNKQIAGRTQRQYYEDNKDTIIQQKKEYYSNNLEKVKQQQKEYVENHRVETMEYQKQYREAHKEELSEYAKQRYEVKKDEIIKHQRQYRKDNLEYVRDQEKRRYYEARRDKLQATYACECGQSIQHASKWSHQKSMKHQQYLQTLEGTN